MTETVKKKQKNENNEEAQLLLKRAVFDYVVEIFKSETERQEILESKSRFYLSFISLFIGSVFLNLSFLNDIKNLFSQTQLTYTVFTVMIGSIISLNISLLFSLLSILVSIGIRSYKDVFPKNVTVQLFSPTSNYLKEKTLQSFYETVSMNYTIALEHNKRVNDKKALWVNFASAFVLISILSLAILLFLISGLVLLF